MPKPKLLMVYDYEMPPHEKRVKHSSPYLLEQALRAYFDVYRVGEIEPLQADLAFNTLPIYTRGGAGYDMFTPGKLTTFWTTSPLEGICKEYFEYCDFTFYSIPSWKNEFPEGSVLLLDAGDPEYKEYPSEKLWDVGFLGSEIEATRVNLLNKIGEEFNLLRGGIDLGEKSARALSQCSIVLSIQDWHHHGAGLERRIFTFGNVRPILVRYNRDYDYVGERYHDYIPYGSDEDCLKQIKIALQNMDITEEIGKNMKETLKKHTWDDRAKTVYNTYLKYGK